ncbi:hypothetical protein PM082_020369 [Marasmius tenuissimus]|nr:hypothetical protein PM082_020369 [Marasmius tenuissimus]
MNCTLVFNYLPGKLTRDVNVVLTFDAPTKSELSTDQNYVAWRVANLKSTPGSTANNQFSVEYANRLGFSVAQLTNGNTVMPSSMIEMTLGQSTDLTLDGSNPTWSNPSGGPGAVIRATNMTKYFQNIAVGTVKDGQGGFSTLEPSFLWKVGENLTAEAKFQPKLKMYVNLGYKESDFITADLASMTPVWTGDLAQLAPLTSFAFAETPQGGYAVTQLIKLSKTVSNLAESASPPSININFRCRLNWQATVGLAVVGATFTSIAKTCAENKYTYTEVKNDKNFYRTIGISKPGQSGNDLHKTMFNTVVNAIKGSRPAVAGVAGTPFSDDDIDKNWIMTDEVATNASSEDGFGGKEDVIVKGSAAWYHLK